MRPILSNLARVAVLAAVGLSPLSAHAHADRPLPEVLQLPLGFQPEGITRGRGHTLFVASINTGGVYRLDPITGRGSILVPGQTGRSGVGIKFDSRTNLLFVAGGPTGHAFVYDASTGAEVADIPLASGPGSSFINDLLITRRAVYFTESFKPVFYKLPLRSGGRLPASPEVEEIPLGGDYQFVADQFNANGVERVPEGDDLLIVNGFTGKLYRVDPCSGDARAVDLGADLVQNGDGLVLRDRLLYVVQNFSNAVSVVKLSRRADRGRLLETITNPNFDIPATAAFLKGALYITNARFSTPVTPTTPYWVVRVPIED
jgi:sugar lactone lactonase YvrE